MLYLPCQTPNEDARAQQAFGIRQGAGDQPIDLEFARKWAQVIQEWSDRYGAKVAGWWFDGGYSHVGFKEAVARIYADAAKHGNPQAIVTFNPGVQVDSLDQGRGLHGRRAERALPVRSDVALGRGFPVARPHLPGLVLVATGYAVPHGAMGRLGSQGRGARGSCHARHGAELEPSGRADRRIGRRSDEPGQGDQGGARSSQPPLPLRGGSNGPRASSASTSTSMPGTTAQSIGKNTTRPMIENIINQVHPDYIQIDCKGHPGLSSYPTKVGNPAPGFVGDPLRALAAGDRRARRGAVHALLRRVGLRGHSTPSRLGRGQRRWHARTARRPRSSAPTRTSS